MKVKASLAFVILFGLVGLSYFMLGTVSRDNVNVDNDLPGVYIPPEKCEANASSASELQNITECGCTRKFFYKAPAIPCKRLDSTCSDEGSFYQTKQNVVSVSISLAIKNVNYTQRQYKEGLTVNLKRMKEYYPGNSMRIYTNVDLEPGSDYCQLLCAHPELHWCDVRKTPSLGDQSEMFPMSWRFLPLGDPTVDYFLSRDLDSVIIERQVGAVQQWLHSDKAFHTMRDHPDHNAPMLAGLWGARNSIIGINTAKALGRKLFDLAKKPPQRKGRDQDVLIKVIFNRKGRWNMVAFDSYFCRDYIHLTEIRPFPVKRKDNTSDFAGNGNLGREKYTLQKCPVECRPEYGKDWEYC